ncbi:hypothetical protein HB772_15845 [Sinorhizobium meliloti]|nr:hypothetical protein HB772_15845 [Sinorhizobium meliloti]
MVKRKPHDPHRSLRGVVVDNPFYSRAHSGTAGNPKQISAIINTRQSGVIMLYSRGRLDLAQLAAANRFGALWETMGGKGAGAIDYGKEPVDGGQRSDPITERQLMAADELRRARCRLRDPDRYRLVCRICGEGYALHELGRSRRGKLAAANELRSCLNDLADLWGLATRRPNPQIRRGNKEE